jgi:hypothetical protein
MTQSTASSKVLGYRVVAGLGFLFSTVLACIFIRSGWSEHQLRRDCKFAEAAVDDFQQPRSRGGSYSVNYQFQLENFQTIHAHGKSIDYESWTQAKTTGKTPIVYEVADPSNNHPLHSKDPPWQDISMGIFFFLVFGAVSYALWTASTPTHPRPPTEGPAHIGATPNDSSLPPAA